MLKSSGSYLCFSWEPPQFGRPESVVGQSRHFDSAPRTSALLRSADIADRVRQVRRVPKSDLRQTARHLADRAKVSAGWKAIMALAAATGGVLFCPPPVSAHRG